MGQEIIYEIKHNDEDFFLPLLLDVKRDGKLLTSESFSTIDEIAEKIKELELILQAKEDEEQILE